MVINWVCSETYIFFSESQSRGAGGGHLIWREHLWHFYGEVCRVTLELWWHCSHVALIILHLETQLLIMTCNNMIHCIVDGTI